MAYTGDFSIDGDESAVKTYFSASSKNRNQPQTRNKYTDEPVSSEDYWNQSEAKGFSFDELGDSQVCGVSLKGASNLAEQIRCGIAVNTSSSTSESGSDSPGTKSVAQYELLQLIPQKALDAILEADNYEFVYTNPSQPKNSLSLENEVKILRRTVQSRWETPSTNQVVRWFLLGKPYSLELFRSLQSKQELLSAVTAFGDGDAILEVVIFLSRSVKSALFQKLISNNPAAINHYVSYLSRRSMIQELTDFLQLLGRKKEVAMKQFEVACLDPEKHLPTLKLCSSDYFQDSKDKVFVDLFIKLIECQVRRRTKVGESSMETVRVLCGGQQWVEQGNPGLELAKEQALSDKQTQWACLTARTALRDWLSIHSILLTKGWLGSKKIKSALPMNDIISHLNECNAPCEVVQIYTDLMENKESRLSLPKKVIP